MSNYSLAVRMYPDVLQTIDFSSLSGTYIGIGLLNHPSLQFILQNWTDVSIMVSWDGVNDHLPIASGAAWDSDNTSNRARESGLYLPQGQRFYVRQIGDTSATSGAIYLTSFYGQGM